MNIKTTPPNPSENSTPHPKPKNRRVGYVFALLCNILFLYIANNLIAWKAQFITNEWTQVLGILNFSIIISLVAYAIFLFYDGRALYLIGRMAMEIVGLIAVFRIYKIFPFDFNGFFQMGWLNNVVPYLLLLCLVGGIINLFVRTTLFVKNRNIYY